MIQSLEIALLGYCRWLRRLPALMALTLLPMVAPAANSPPASVAEAVEPERWLFIVEKSWDMHSRMPGLIQSLEGMIKSGAQKQLRPGDSIGFWTFNQRLYTGDLPLHYWSDKSEQELPTQLSAFLKRQKFEKAAKLEVVLPALKRLAENSDAITFILFLSSQTSLQGTPFDAEINRVSGKWREEQRKQKMPFIVVLRAERGRLTSFSAGPAQWPLSMPEHSPRVKIVSTPKATPTTETNRPSASARQTPGEVARNAVPTGTVAPSAPKTERATESNGTQAAKAPQESPRVEPPALPASPPSIPTLSADASAPPLLEPPPLLPTPTATAQDDSRQGSDAQPSPPPAQVASAPSITTANPEIREDVPRLLKDANALASAPAVATEQHNPPPAGNDNLPAPPNGGKPAPTTWDKAPGAGPAGATEVGAKSGAEGETDARHQPDGAAEPTLPPEATPVTATETGGEATQATAAVWNPLPIVAIVVGGIAVAVGIGLVLSKRRRPSDTSLITQSIHRTRGD